MEEKIFLSVDEACKCLGVGRTTLNLLFSRNDLNRVKIGRRTFVHKDNLAAFIERQCEKAAA